MENIEVGSFLIYLALFVAVGGIVFSLWGHFTQRRDLTTAGRNATIAVLALTTLAVLRLEWALHTHDFSLEFVWAHTDRSMSFGYLTASLWGGMAGSLLFWAWILSIYATVAVLWGQRRVPELVPVANATLLITFVLFALIISVEANPFDPILHPATQQPFTPADGRGLNPLLQNYWMMIHPVGLYTGFVGFTVPFAFCIGALATGKLDAAWTRATRRWTLWAWGVLGIAIILGGTWAYEELGWGGYWAWDPVENASLIPWLTGTAYVHSVIVQEKRGMLKVWNVVLVLLTFHLCIFGTFLTRSGVVSSVHAFAEGNIGWYFLTFLIISGIGCAALVFSRLDKLSSDNRLESAFSRETMFLLNNWLFLVFALIVITGTMLPVLTEMISGTKWVVSQPFFNFFVVPLAMILLLLTALGQAMAWRKTSNDGVQRSLAPPAAVGLLSFVVFLFLSGAAGWVVARVGEVALGHAPAMPTHGWLAAVAHNNGWPVGDERIAKAGAAALWSSVGFSLCAFLVAGIVWEYVRSMRSLTAGGKNSWGGALLALFRHDANRRRYGGYLVHLAIAVVCAGMIGSSAFGVEKPMTLKVGEQVDVGRWAFTLTRDVDIRREPGHDAVVASVRVEKNGKKVGTMFPEKRFYAKQEQPTTEPSIATWMMNDVYLIIEGYDMRSVEGGRQWPTSPITARVYINPMVQWIWKGMVLFGLAVALCYWPARRRFAEKEPAREGAPAGASARPALSARKED